MELPISTIIVFFVAIVVAVLVIGFAGDMLSKGKADLENNPLIEKKSDEDIVLELSSITTQQVVPLAKKCKEQSIGKELNSRNCYILHGALATNNEQLKAQLPEDEGYYVEVSPSAGKTVYIRYDSLKNRIEVEG